MQNRYELFVDKSVDSKKAATLCGRFLKELDIIDVSDIGEPLDLCPRPRLLAPEGRFKHLEGIKKYISHYVKHHGRTPLTGSSDLWTIFPVLPAH